MRWHVRTVSLICWSEEETLDAEGAFATVDGNVTIDDVALQL